MVLQLEWSKLYKLHSDHLGMSDMVWNDLELIGCRKDDSGGEM